MEDRRHAHDQEHLADVEVGEILRRTRIHYGQSLDDVERILRIRKSQLEAIEKGDTRQLPGRVYAIGFVRTYAEYLGLDGGKVVHLFKTQYIDAQPKEVLVFPVPASETKTPPVWIAFASIAAMVVLFAAWNVWQGKANTDTRAALESVPSEIKERVSKNVSQPEMEQQQAALDVVGPMGPQQPKAMTEPPAAENAETHKGVILNIKNNSWVEIKGQDGKILVANVLKKGDQYFVPDSPGLTMSLGNAGGVELTMNGKPLMPLGKEGDILRDIPLDTAYLKTLEFKPEAPKPAPEPEKPAAAVQEAPVQKAAPKPAEVKTEETPQKPVEPQKTVAEEKPRKPARARVE